MNTNVASHSSPPFSFSISALACPHTHVCPPAREVVWQISWSVLQAPGVIREVKQFWLTACRGEELPPERAPAAHSVLGVSGFLDEKWNCVSVWTESATAQVTEQRGGSRHAFVCLTFMTQNLSYWSSCNVWNYSRVCVTVVFRITAVIPVWQKIEVINMLRGKVHHGCIFVSWTERRIYTHIHTYILYIHSSCWLSVSQKRCGNGRTSAHTCMSSELTGNSPFFFRACQRPTVACAPKPAILTVAEPYLLIYKSES